MDKPTKTNNITKGNTQLHTLEDEASKNIIGITDKRTTSTIEVYIVSEH